MDDVQVVVADEPKVELSLVHITDPVCRGLKFGSGPRETWITLSVNLPDNVPQDAPDSILAQYPGEGFYDLQPPDDPDGVIATKRAETLEAFRKFHGGHAKIEDVSVKEPVRGKPKR